MRTGARVHEILSWVAQAASDPSTITTGANNSDVLIAIVGSVGTLAAAGIAAFVSSFKRAKTPESTVDSIDNLNAIRHDDAFKEQINDLRLRLKDAEENLDMANYEKDNNFRLYYKLREAVRSHGLNPDTIMSEMT